MTAAFDRLGTLEACAPRPSGSARVALQTPA